MSTSRDASERDRIVEEVLDGTQLSLNWGGLGFQRHQPLRVIDVLVLLLDLFEETIAGNHVMYFLQNIRWFLQMVL